MPCVNTHSSTSQTQGPGVCCAALAASGQAARVGLRLQTQSRAGKCIVCEVTTSRSPKHAGQLVFKRGRNAGAVQFGSPCPSSSHGCCALAATGTGA